MTKFYIHGTPLGNVLWIKSPKRVYSVNAFEFTVNRDDTFIRNAKLKEVDEDYAIEFLTKECRVVDYIRKHNGVLIVSVQKLEIEI